MSRNWRAMRTAFSLEDYPRINRTGGLTILIGRENESAATLIASTLDHDTAATFVGE